MAARDDIGLISGPALRERIARLYALHPEGARAKADRRGLTVAYGVRWLAKRLHRTPRTVYRWIDGTHRPDPLAVEVLERLEREASATAMLRARPVDRAAA